MSAFTPQTNPRVLSLLLANHPGLVKTNGLPANAGLSHPLPSPCSPYEAGNAFVSEPFAQMKPRLEAMLIGWLYS